MVFVLLLFYLKLNSPQKISQNIIIPTLRMTLYHQEEMMTGFSHLGELSL